MNYTQMQQWFSDRQPRERQLVLIAGLFLILYGGYMLFVEPSQLRVQQLENQIAQHKEQSSALQSQAAALIAGSQDPDAAVKRRISQLMLQKVELEKQIDDDTSDLIPPHRMRNVLQALLAENDDLHLLEMRSLPAVNLTEQDQAKDGSEQSMPGLYQQGLILIVEGKYFALQAYLTELEMLPWRFHWQRMAYSVQEPPVGRMEIELSTLSTDKAFVGI
ncbi:type II secretion system protein GspM [Lacimicrobium alkaliphilum]|uniref:MSHA biogenesis protein MshJ n=1 Tax=Lacimicrobium alkaliphilum TaxID=1526571 RepID=A0ABQ1R891_9ALTE|nr:type II secretion system protein GspM [Lacimicrobium alkaliphilum]GGD61831.1 hypothetical protein GCM10011357_16380 [Lacimicrobium alkaliphilum]